MKTILPRSSPQAAIDSFSHSIPQKKKNLKMVTIIQIED